MLHEGWHREVTSSNVVIGMVLGWSWKVLDEQQLHGLASEPVGFHWPEWDDIDVVHQRVGMRHLSF